MRRLILASLIPGFLGLAAFAASAVLVGTAAAQQSPAAVTLTGAERTEALAQASAALNQQQRLQGRFRQTAADGSVTAGRFYLQRPGRLRFEYDAPAQLLIVADGSIVAVQDIAMRSTNRSPLRSTPLFFVLKSDINLDRDTRVTRVVRQGAWLYVTARDRSGQADGEITLHLYGSNLDLRSWDVVDGAGSRTRIALSDVSRPSSIDARLFRAPAAGAQSPRGPGR